MSNSFDETEQKLHELITNATTLHVVVSVADLSALMFEMELWRNEYYNERRVPEGIVSRYPAVVPGSPEAIEMVAEKKPTRSN